MQRGKKWSLAMTGLTSVLSTHDFAALKEVSKGQMQGHIAEASRETLLRLKLITVVLGGLKLTAEGQTRLLMRK